MRQYITNHYPRNGIHYLLDYLKEKIFNIKIRFPHLNRGFWENDLHLVRTWNLLRGNNGNSKLDWSSLYNDNKRLFKPRKGIPPIVWTVKKDITKETNDLVEIAGLQESQEALQEKIQNEYSFFNILNPYLEIARTIYSAKDGNGDYIHSMRELRGKRLTDYGLRKIASELNLELRVTRVSEEEKQHIIDVYNNLKLYKKKRVTNDTLVRLLHRDIKTIYNVLNSSESEINWKRRRGAKIIKLDDYKEPQPQSLGIVA